MTDSTRARTYAQALHQNVVEATVRQLRSVQAGLRSNPDVRQVLGDPTVEFRDKARRVLDFLPSGASSDVQKFVQYLLNEGALDDLDQIIVELDQLGTGGPRVLEGSVTSAVPLTDQEQAALREKLTAEAGASLDLTFHVDPEIMGGLIVQVGDRVVDASVATRFRHLKDSITKAL